MQLARYENIQKRYEAILSNGMDEDKKVDLQIMLKV